MIDWRGRKVVILGAARQGLALARYLALLGARVLLNDRQPASALKEAIASLDDLSTGSVEWVTGGHPLEVLEGAALLCPSGGVPLTLPLVQEALRRGIPLSNDSQIFLEAAPCPVIGITGSAGKTTTTTLVGRMAWKAGGKWMHQPGLKIEQGGHAWVGGNIGSPLISVLDEMKPGDLAVMELSSFQLELMTRSPQVAAVLNITPNHLDRHPSMEAYTAAKARILEYQDSEYQDSGYQDSDANRQACAVVLNREDPGSWGLARKVHSHLWTFGVHEPENSQPATFLRGERIILRRGESEKSLMPRSAVQLRGEHNLLNVLAACAIAAAAEFPEDALREGVEGFSGVPHRLEFVRSWKGAAWYNDSIATAPERTIAAIRSFDEALVLLVGGRDKNLPWNDLAVLVRQRVEHLILFGEASQKIWDVLHAEKQAAGREWPYSVSRLSGLRQAVQAAAQVVEPGDVVLLSPGCTSFDEFRDFEDRGEAYKQWVMELI